MLFEFQKIHVLNTNFPKQVIFVYRVNFFVNKLKIKGSRKSHRVGFSGISCFEPDFPRRA